MSYPPPPAGAAPASDKVTLWGVLGIVGAICCWPVGVVFAVLCLQEAKKVGKPPTLAYVGFVIAGLNIIWYIFALSTGVFTTMLGG